MNESIFPLKDNYPLHKETSDLDIALPTGTQDNEYLKVLEETLPQLIEKQKPDLPLLRSAGGADEGSQRRLLSPI